MASNSKKIYRPADDVLEDILNSDFEVDSDSERGELSSEEKELIDQGIDPEVLEEQSRYVCHQF